MNLSHIGTSIEPLTILQKLHRASCMVEVVKEACLASDNPCEGETLGSAAALIVEVHDELRRRGVA
jgi:hypothetical protein